MNNSTPTDAWISYLVMVLGLTVAASAVRIITLVIMSQPVPKLLIVLGLIALTGLVQLLVPSPLDRL